jgi:hypothetical protein
VIATGKHNDHLATTGDCVDCHSTVAWLPANFSHDGITGACSSCHNNVVAVGKPSGHIETSVECDACHTSNAWLPASFDHSAAANASLLLDCSGCHAADWDAEPHKKTENPSLILYTLTELRDCTTSCHIYTDNTFTTIATRRDSHHQATDGSF